LVYRWNLHLLRRPYQLSPFCHPLDTTELDCSRNFELVFALRARHAVAGAVQRSLDTDDR